ncbi:MAG: TetR/AcrR family transcriptional regulator [Ruminococcus flavefaciens]|nr:TetR/AcrR family transcriptional regulator [Ruminococcus flavefaciens]
MMGNDKKDGTDRRVRRTRALLQQGLIQLMETKDVKDISVKELSDLADINRGTFYLHYTDIYDMLEKMEDELFREFNEILDRTLTRVPDSSETTLNEIFAFLERHRAFARVTMGPHGDLTFVNKLKKLVQERLYSILTVAQKEQDLVYIESFIVSGCTGVIETWLNHPDPRPPEEIAAICEGLLRKGFHLVE